MVGISGEEASDGGVSLATGNRIPPKTLLMAPEPRGRPRRHPNLSIGRFKPGATECDQRPVVSSAIGTLAG